MRRPYNFPALIQELHGQLNQSGELDQHEELDQQSERWRSRAHEIVAGRLESPHEFLDWAKQDHHWSYTLAEVMREVWTKPSELANRLLVAILAEMSDEQQTAQALSE